jgi:pyruvate formate-lyase/glycerol dehydratase family glycyl radical enzyme
MDPAEAGIHRASDATVVRKHVSPTVVPPLPRLTRLREALLEAPYHLCTQKAELLTAFFRAHASQHPLTRLLAPLHFTALRRGLNRHLSRGGARTAWQTAVNNGLQRLYLALERGREAEPPVVTFARALAFILERQTLRIYDDELVVGNLTAHRIAAAIHPDFGGMLLLPELRRLARRPVNPLRVSDEQIRRLESQVFPFWFTRSIMTRTPLLAQDPALQNTLLRGRDFVLTQFAGISHVTPDYPAVLAKGFLGILAEIEAASALAATAEERAFYDAGALAARAAVAFGRRWAAHCTARADTQADTARAAELRALAAILSQVPARPARSFHEALQSLFLTHVIVHQESFQHGVSFGRVDQYLYPYYADDIVAGRLTRPRAVELIGCFLAKAAEQLPLFNAMATEYFSGLSSASGLTLGGVDAAGRDATNELSYLFLIAYDRLRLRQPNLHLRVHPESPAALLTLAYETLKRGGGMPALFNDAAIIPALETAEVTPVDARNYSIVGCVEWGVPCKSFPAAGAAFLSLPAALDDALRDVARSGGRASAMDDILAAFQRCLAATIDTAVAGNDAIERAHAAFRPTPLLSVLIDGCITNGRDVTAAGAHYNSTGFQGVGLADVADSLAAVEQIVCTERRLTLGELVAVLDANFLGHEDLRQRLLNKVGRYGEDAGRAEFYAGWVARLFADLVRRHRNPRGGPYVAGFWTMTTHVGFGARLGALPNGRRAGQPLSDGISPVNGADSRGPTASLLAATHVAGPFVGNGVALNEKLDPCYVAGGTGTQLMDGLTRGYFQAGGQQVQYNIVDPAVLIDAKLHPERHRGLVVRISGYSAYFNDLTEAMKDDLIARTSHGSAQGPGCQAPPTSAA